MILTAPNFLGSSEFGVYFVNLSFMGSKNLHVSLCSARKETDHMPLCSTTIVNILSLWVRIFLV
jgi:hypothetical protein